MAKVIQNNFVLNPSAELRCRPFKFLKLIVVVV